MNTASASAAPLRIWFDLEGQEQRHRREWEIQLAAMSASSGAEAQLGTTRDQADCVIYEGSRWHFGAGGGLFGRRTRPAPGSPPSFVWDYGDAPAGRDPGFYCSLPRSLFDPRRHRAACYPIRYNECVQPADLSEAHTLFGFVGGITSGLRARLVDALRRHARPDEMHLVVQLGPWTQMFDRSGIAAKRQYAQALRKTRFFLCPRGNGLNSVRLFETMRAARVPVILSDDCVLPTRIDWPSCSVRVPERDLARLPEILRARAADWPRLAANARRAWEENFSDASLLPHLATDLRALLAARAEERLLAPAWIAAHALRFHTRRLAGRLLARLRSRQSPER